MTARSTRQQNRVRQRAGAPATTSAIAAEPPLSPDASLLKVALRFFIIYAVLQTAVWFLGYRGFLDPLRDLVASIAGSCTSLTGVDARVSGADVALTTRILRIDVDCTGISLWMIYSALVLAYPLRPRLKLIGLTVGLPVLFVINLVRLVLVAQLSEHLSDSAFFFAHDYLFQIVMMGVVIGLWAIYLGYAKRHG